MERNRCPFRLQCQGFTRGEVLGVWDNRQPAHIMEMFEVQREGAAHNLSADTRPNWSNYTRALHRESPGFVHSVAVQISTFQGSME